MHYDEVKFQAMWAQYERLCVEVGKILPTIIEWPSDQTYWERPRMLEALKRNNMYCTSFDGDIIHFAPEVDIPLATLRQRNWKFATNIYELTSVFDMDFSGLSLGKNDFNQTSGKLLKRISDDFDGVYNRRIFIYPWNCHYIACVCISFLLWLSYHVSWKNLWQSRIYQKK